MPDTSRSGTSGKLRSEMGRSGSPSKSRMAQRGPARPRLRREPAGSARGGGRRGSAGAARRWCLRAGRAGRSALLRKARRRGRPRPRTDARAGLLPARCPAPGADSAAVPSASASRRCTVAVAAPSAWASAVKSDPPAGRVHGEPPRIAAAGEEFVRHSQLALRRDGQWRDVGHRMAPPLLRPPAPPTRPSPSPGLPGPPRCVPRSAPHRSRPPGFCPSDSTRKNFTMATARRRSSSTITELLDCSPDEDLDLAGGERQAVAGLRTRWPVAVARGVVAPCRMSSSQAAMKDGVMDAVVDPRWAASARRAGKFADQRAFGPRQRFAPEAERHLDDVGAAAAVGRGVGHRDAATPQGAASPAAVVQDAGRPPARR